jgi:MoxR-like ATPase
MTATTPPAVGGERPVASPEDLAARLGEVGYLADESLATTAYLALDLGRPLFVEGDPGTGKTALALGLAEALGAPLIRLQCYEGLRVEQALYDWDFPRQLLHLRVAEATGRADQVEGELYSRRFLLARPIVEALERSSEQRRSVLLIDEIDRADDEFEAFLLEVLSEWAVTIPELGTIRAEVPPIVIVTSNRTRDVHDALKRRCLYHWLDHPDVEREVAILLVRVPGVGEHLARQVAEGTAALRSLRLTKPPGVAEAIDWATALVALGATRLDTSTVGSTLGAVLKYHEDHQRVQGLPPDALLTSPRDD